MDWKAKVELFEQLRQEHEFGVGTISGVAAKFGVHRRMVRQAIAGALPPAHRYPTRIKPKLDRVAAFIDQVLDEDRRAPRKQRHTARRIYRRILTEFPDAGLAESTVRNHVRARKRALGVTAAIAAVIRVRRASDCLSSSPGCTSTSVWMEWGYASHRLQQAMLSKPQLLQPRVQTSD